MGKAGTLFGCQTTCGGRWMRSISWIIAPTRNEFVEKALRQYCGRLHAERTGAYLPRALQEVLEGTLGVFGDRLGRLLFKLVVEHNMTNHLLGGDVDMTRDEYSKMRGSSVREVASTHGNISFKDVLLFHQEE